MRRKQKQQTKNPKKEKTRSNLDRSDLLIETPFAENPVFSGGGLQEGRAQGVASNLSASTTAGNGIRKPFRTHWLRHRIRLLRRDAVARTLCTDKSRPDSIGGGRGAGQGPANPARRASATR
jgi:hypothetical protein